MSDDGFGDDADRPRTWSQILRVTVAFFKDYRAKAVRHETLELGNLLGRLTSQTAAEKAKLPWLKLALFGDLKTDKGSLRHDANILEISGIELDYDGEKIPFEIACQIAEDIGLLCIIYTSPSHTEDTPRWRILCPLSTNLPPEQRYTFCSMVNGAFGRIFAAESWTLSQAYYFGAILLDGRRNPSHQARLIEGTPINLKTELLIGAAGKPDTVADPRWEDGDTSNPIPALRVAAVDEKALVKAIASGDSLHVPALRLVGRWAAYGTPMAEARTRLMAAFDACSPDVRTTERWRTRREHDVPRVLEWVYNKEIDKRGDPLDEAPPDDPEQAARKALHESLAKSKEGLIYGTHANLILLMDGDPALRGLVTYNEFNNQTLLTRPVPDPFNRPRGAGQFPRVMTDTDAIAAAVYLQGRWSRQFRVSTAHEGLLLASMEAKFHPVRDWLNSLEWDGKPRLDMWLCDVFDCTPDKYTLAVAAKTLIGAVRRVRRPGCAFDYMLILEGRQQIGKSTALQILFGEAWYADTLPADIASKDAAIGLSGKWCIELSEIAQLVRATHEVAKAFFSRKTDHYRPPFGKSAVDVPRQTVLVGTTNRDDYLSDITGNRRYWPVRCLLGPDRANAFANLDWLRSNRAQLWAEAAAREAAGEAEWLDDAAIAATALFHQNARMFGDPWQDTVLRYAEQNWPVGVGDIMRDALQIEQKYHDKRQQMRVADILRRAGWRMERVQDGKSRIRKWLPGSADGAEWE